MKSCEKTGFREACIWCVSSLYPILQGNILVWYDMKLSKISCCDLVAAARMWSFCMACRSAFVSATSSSFGENSVCAVYKLYLCCGIQPLVWMHALAHPNFGTKTGG